MSSKTFLIGSMAGALALGLSIGAVQAQNYAGPETVYVHPIPDRIYHGSVKPGMNGYLYAEQVSASRRVDISDINLSRPAGWRELQLRVSDTARDLCAGLQNTDRFNLDRDEFRSCVSKATDQAMRDVSLS